ncbi:hypothetical protein E5676_scaffold609G00240 [Cucumis melo var. makuwa]|uniref:DUF4218 domain-containing protein n=1 Tax=Cucumis melo var. makuwa TaxID=1194695 RepID=A0A5D3DDL4_CUCMM|nr:hypothetical protein E5676_scaffold609G00240 [Cucumis melo var. makuwa]
MLFDVLLELLRVAFPMCSTTIPSSFYEAKRKLHDLGLGYETIHACKYDCVLYWKEFVDLQHCPTCGEARYKEGSTNMRWYRDKCIKKDDVLRHPTDAEVSSFNYMQPCYGRLITSRYMVTYQGGVQKGHRRYLPENHVWRRSRLHDGKVERRVSSVVMNGHEILEQLDQLEFPVMSEHPLIQDKKRKSAFNWTKISIFSELPYWSRLLLRHKLDVMHIEKNVCENWLNIEGKTKDTTNARLDLQYLKIRKDLHLVEMGNQLVKPHASYTLTSSERVEFCNWMYPIERSLRTLKQYVRNKAHPEGSIAEVYVMNESSIFCSRYLSDIKTRFTRDERNNDTIVEDEVIGDFEIFKQKVRPLGASSVRAISQEEKRLFHWFIEHQTLTTFKEFRGECHRHFKKYSDLEEARANPPNVLVGRHED